ncbi:MAG TPA: TetR family transcriptional regulator [Solirubrobacteraceae bacterium]|nr:TetR family transcriptional regulator [Solirubrobacteraceae bacterium]
MQRSRLLTAAFGVVAEHGWEGASVERITGSAGVSRRTFYDLFKDREDCLVAVLENAVAQVTRELASAEVADLPWRERVRDGLWAILCLFDRDPALARVCIVESRRGGPAVLLYRQRIIDGLAKIVDEGRGEGAGDAATLTAQGVIGGVSEVLYSLLLKAWGEPLRALLSELMGMIVLPYMGPAAARREQASPVPAFQSSGQLNGETASGDGEAPLAALPMRMTYRTARVLQALAERPGQSNRQVGEMVDISDQGQTSKLLARLERLGLLVNSERTQGERNQWTLTPIGSQVTKSIQSYAPNTRSSKQVA